MEIWSKPIAVLSSTFISNRPGDYRYELWVEIGETHPEVTGLPNYVGHLATRRLLGLLGAVYTAGYFPGLEIGESFLVAQLKDPRKGNAFTADHSDVTLADLKWGKVTRIA